MTPIKLSNTQGRLPIWLSIVIMLAALSLIIWLIASNQTNQPSDTIIQPNDADQPQPVYSYVGIIQTMEDGSIRLLVPADRNGLTADKLVEVNFNEQTLITKRTIPKTLPANATGAERLNAFSRETVDASSLTVGADITVVSDIDISQLNSFQASRIEVRNITTN